MKSILLVLRIACGAGHEDLAPHIEAATKRHAVPVSALVALIASESSCRPWAINRRTGATGLGQILPGGSANRERYSQAELKGVALGAMLAARHLARCLRERRTLAKAASRYNGAKRCMENDFGRTVAMRARFLESQTEGQ